MDKENIMTHKVILVSCVSGMATAETTAAKIRKIAAEHKWDVSVKVAEFRKLKEAVPECDVLVQIAPSDPTNYGIPKINGVPFLTGFELDETIQALDEIINAEPTKKPEESE
jgi:PTS system galactitol-specific IIB component